MTTKKPEIKSKKTKLVCTHHKVPTLGCEICRPKFSGKAKMLQAIENAEQVKSWSKYDVPVKYSFALMVSIILGIVLGILSTHSTVMEMLKVCTN